MNKINCNIFSDLLPLVIDDVASKDSKDAVKDHINQCKNCKQIYIDIKEDILLNKEEKDIKNIEIDDKKVIFNIRKKLYIITSLFLLIGSFISVSLIDSVNMFYNILILPLLGSISYLVFSRNSYKVAFSVFMTSYIWQFIKIFIEMDKPRELYILFIYPLYLSFIFYILFTIGIIIAVLLKFGLSKEEDYEYKN